QIALRHGTDDSRRFARRMDEVVDEHVDRIDRVAPEPRDIAQRPAPPELAFLADDTAQSRELLRHALVALDDIIEYVGHSAGGTDPVDRQSDPGVAAFQRIECAE